MKVYFYLQTKYKNKSNTEKAQSESFLSFKMDVNIFMILRNASIS